MIFIRIFLSFGFNQGNERGGGGQNTWDSDWLKDPKILVNYLVKGATIKRVGALSFKHLVVFDEILYCYSRQQGLQNSMSTSKMCLKLFF